MPSRGLPRWLSGKAPAKQEKWVRSLGQEDPLEKETATDSGIRAWKSHGQTSLAVYWVAKESDTT